MPRRWQIALVVLAGIILAHCVAPLVWYAQEQDIWMPPHVERVEQVGCNIEQRTAENQTGWIVYVWANYSRKAPKVKERDWGPKWYSFREGSSEKTEERAYKDCAEWRKKVREAREKAISGHLWTDKERTDAGRVGTAGR